METHTFETQGAVREQWKLRLSRAQALGTEADLDSLGEGSPFSLGVAKARLRLNLHKEGEQKESCLLFLSGRWLIVFQSDFWWYKK